MQLRYGSLLFEVNGTVVSTDKELIEDDVGRVIATRVSFNVTGQWTGNTQAQLAAKCALMEATLALPGRDLVLYRNDGGVAIALTNRGSYTGVRVTRGPAYPEGNGGEFSTYRNFSFTAEAEYSLVAGALLYKQWHEDVEVRGGFPLGRILRGINGVHQPQIIYPSTPLRVTQTGVAVGLGFLPPPAPMLLPPITLVEEPSVRRGSGEGRGAAEFSVAWNYVFEVLGGVAALPHRRPG
jgi:hypothetical protein